MPNYCTNIVKAPKEVLEDLFDNGKVTFEKLIPMPKTLNITEGTVTENAIAYAISKKETEKELGIKTLEEFGNLCLNNILKYGSVNWYDWSCNNWGTKWDAIQEEGSPEDGELIFLTAWSEPIKVIEKLFYKYPNAKIEWKYIGECNEYEGKYYSDGKGNVKSEYKEKEYEGEEEE